MDRKEFIGASEVAALLDVHPFKKPIDVFNEKMGLTEEKPPSKAAELGNCLEPGLIEYFNKQYLRGTIKSDSYQRHIRVGHAGSTLDICISHGSYKRRKFPIAPMDIKTIGLNGTLPYHAHYGKGGSAEVPTHVYYQLQMQCHLLTLEDDVDIADGFIGLLGLQGQGTMLYRVPYKKNVGAMLLERIEDFWSKYIETKTPPPDTHQESEILF